MKRLLIFTLITVPFVTMAQVTKKQLYRASSLYERATDLYFEQNYVSAYEFIKKAMKIYPDILGGYCLRGRIRWKMGNDASALADLTLAAQKEPKNENIYVDIGDIYAEQRAYEKAYVAYGKAIARKPKDPFLYWRRAKFSRTQKWHEKALADYQQAHKLAPNEANYLRSMGIVLGNLGRYQEELAVYDTLLQLLPNDGVVYSTIGGVYSINLKEYLKELQYYFKGLPLIKDTFALDLAQDAMKRCARSWYYVVSEHASEIKPYNNYVEKIYWEELAILIALIYEKKSEIMEVNDLALNRRLYKHFNQSAKVYWENPLYKQAWEHYEAKRWPEALQAFQALQKIYLKEEILTQTIWFCNLYLGNYKLKD